MSISIVLPISRREYLLSVFESLNQLEKPPKTELLLVLQGSRSLQQEVEALAENLNFYCVKFIDTKQSAATTINDRRYNISQVHNLAKHFVETDYVFLIEDDTTFPPDTLVRMLDTLEKYEDCGFVEGVQVSRHNTPYVGAWVADDVQQPKIIRSVMRGVGVEPIDAGGLYCALTLADEYKYHHFEPYDKQGTNGLSCDVNYGLALRNKGYSCYIDWSIVCGHLSEKGNVTIENTEPVGVVFNKDNGKWECKRV